MTSEKPPHLSPEERDAVRGTSLDLLTLLVTLPVYLQDRGEPRAAELVQNILTAQARIELNIREGRPAFQGIG